MTRALALLLVSLVLCAPRAAAQVDGDIWTDPTLDAAVKDADLITVSYTHLTLPTILLV